MKIRRSLVTVIIALTLGLTGLLSTSPNVSASTSIPAKMNHKWIGHKWHQTFRLNLHKRYAKFYDGAWHKLYYKRISNNNYYVGPKANRYEGIGVHYRNANKITVNYDTAVISFHRVNK